jgi:hypothetical protein
MRIRLDEIHADICSMIERGHTIEDIYIYWKDYVSLEDVIAIYEQERACQ